MTLTRSYRPPAWIEELAPAAIVPATPPLAHVSFRSVWPELVDAARARTLSRRGSSFYAWGDPPDTAAAEIRALAVRVFERVVRGEADADFDVELEAATLALAESLRIGPPDRRERLRRAYWHWAERAGRPTALRTFFRSLGFKTNHRYTPTNEVFLDVEVSPTLRDGDDAFLASVVAADAALASVVLELCPTRISRDRCARLVAAGAVDQAADLVESAPADEIRHLGALLPLARTVEHASALIRAGGCRGPDLTRAMISFGESIASAVLEGAEAERHVPGRWIGPLACLPSERAATLLITQLKPGLDEARIERALHNMPEHAVVVLERVRPSRPKHRKLIDGLLSRLREVDVPLTIEPENPNPDRHDAHDDLPAILRAPPWSDPTGRSTKGPAKKAPRLFTGAERVVGPRLRSGAPFNTAMTTVLIQLLALSARDRVVDGLDDVWDACDEASAIAFLESLVDAWITGGMVPAHSWVLRGAALFGSDAALPLLDRFARTLLRDASRSRALACLDAIGSVGSIHATRVLARFAHGAKSDVVRDHAQALLVRIASSLGISVDALEDEIADDLGLSPDGERSLAPGGAYVVRLGPDLSLQLVGTDGRRLRTIPKAAAEAATNWRALRTEAPRVVRAHVSRLERMMGDERRVAGDVFVRSFVSHPVVGPIVSKLVWCAFDGGGGFVTSFMLRSGALADIDVQPMALDGTTIGLLHPSASYVNVEEIARWRAQLESRAIEQPFDQLGRRIEALTLEELVARTQDGVATTDKLFALRSVGWRMEQNSMDVRALTRRLGSNELRLAIDPPLFSRTSVRHRVRLEATGDAGFTPVQLGELAAQLARLDDASP